ncbi:MAG TPA: hypothetical protein VJZ00_03440 [Thermoanaerobaculia bacterium]|nr:hypothetical protein [Thermoanaerobaculia bacterium]
MKNTARLWTGFVGPALLWFTHLEITYSLHPSACDAKSELMLWITTIILLACVALIGAMTLAMWRANPDPHPTGAAGAPEEEEVRSNGRARFMAAAGFASACLFGLAILVHVIPMVVLRPCD